MVSLVYGFLFVGFWILLLLFSTFTVLGIDSLSPSVPQIQQVILPYTFFLTLFSFKILHEIVLLTGILIQI